MEALPSITRLSERVVRILGQNPGKFTLQGTNTYIIGKRNPYTLIDTGEGREEYIPFLESALREHAPLSDPTKPHISDIVLSHWHHDHVNGIPSVLALLRRLWDERNDAREFTAPRLHKFPLLKETPEKGLSSIISSLPPKSFEPAANGSPFHDLHDFQILAGDDTSLQVIHTPGHTTDSICLYLHDDKALYTADTVLGQGTAVFEDLAAYITSLRKMLAFGESNSSPPTDFKLVYPGHGPVVPDGPALINTYIKHRLEREEEIIAVLKTKPSTSESWTIWGIVGVIYASYPESLWLAAAQGIGLHLKKLESEGRVRYLGGEGKDMKWELLSNIATSRI